MAKVLNKRGTRAELNAAASVNQLNAGEVYLVIDENRLAVGLTSSTYESIAKQSEASATPSVTLSSAHAITFGIN